METIKWKRVQWQYGKKTGYVRSKKRHKVEKHKRHGVGNMGSRYPRFTAGSKP